MIERHLLYINKKYYEMFRDIYSLAYISRSLTLGFLESETQ